MKAMLGFGVLLLFLAGIAFFMLQGRQLAAQNLPAGGAEITGVSWRPALIGNEAMPTENRMFVQFEIDGSIKGHGGCNSFFGTLEQSEEGITIGPLGSTRMACPEPIMAREMAFMDALQKTKQFDMTAERLRLIGDDNAELAELVPGTDVPSPTTQ